MAQLSKLYSSKRTPTANAVMIAGGNSRDSQSSQGATTGNQAPGRKTQQPTPNNGSQSGHKGEKGLKF